MASIAGGLAAIPAGSILPRFAAEKISSVPVGSFRIRSRKSDRVDVSAHVRRRLGAVVEPRNAAQIIE